MWSIIIYLVVTLCVANASIVTVGVYDEPDQESAEGLSDCNFNACVQMCHRLGFPDGACVNGRCKCDNFKNALDTSLGIQSEVNSEDYTLGSCNNLECDQRCRRLKFPGGACVNGRCKCDLFRNIEDFLPESQYEDNYEDFTLSSCNYQECNQRCRRLKFPSGACVNGRCKCDYLNAEDDVTHFPQFTLESSAAKGTLKCNTQLNEFCDRICRILQYDSGTCANGACKCMEKDSNVAGEISNQSHEHSNQILKREEENLEIYENEIGVRATCNAKQCRKKCIRADYYGGVCRNGKCYCYR